VTLRPLIMAHPMQQHLLFVVCHVLLHQLSQNWLTNFWEQSLSSEANSDSAN